MPPLSTPHTIIPAGSAGLVESQIMRFDQPLMLECGRALEQFELIYETYGSLNPDRSNAVLVCHALSSDHHAAGFHSLADKKPGWWDAMIGPGKAIDTLKFYVVCMLQRLNGTHLDQPCYWQSLRSRFSAGYRQRLGENSGHAV